MNFSRGVGGSLSYLWKFRRGGGVSVPIKNGKSREVGVLSEIPSVVGVWIFPGATHFVKYLMRESYSFWYGLKELLPLLKLDDKLRLSSTIKTDDVTRSLNNGHMFQGQVGSLVADKITKIHSQYFWWWTASHRLSRVFHKTLEQSSLARHWKLAIPKACFHIKLQLFKWIIFLVFLPKMGVNRMNL